MKKTLATMAATATLLLATGCSTYSFETEPLDGDMTGDTDTGWEGDPRSVNCVQIEADGASDEDDVQMGEFCKTPSDRGEDLEDDD